MKWNSTLFRRLKFTEAQYRTHLRLRYQEIPMSSDQTWNPQRYGEHAHFVPALGQPLLDLLNVKAGERILDLACGDGVLSKKITDVGGSWSGLTLPRRWCKPRGNVASMHSSWMPVT